MFDSVEKRNKKNEYLEKNVFYGLKNLNDGFDASSNKYFSEEDFEIVLKPIKEFKLGITGIKPWKDGEYYCVVTFEEKTEDPQQTSIGICKHLKNLNATVRYYSKRLHIIFQMNS